MTSKANIINILNERIMILDGAMGTMIQKHELVEDDYRGEEFSEHNSELRGNNDLLSLTRPELISQIHEDYLAAGADIIETNTFNATRIAMADYNMEDQVIRINRESARLARTAADKYSTDEKPRLVAGVLGPTNRTASISPDVNDPGYRNVTFDELVENYREASIALLEGGANILMIETIFDTLNAKAAIFAVRQLIEDTGVDTPVMTTCATCICRTELCTWAKRFASICRRTFTSCQYCCICTSKCRAAKCIWWL